MSGHLLRHSRWTVWRRLRRAERTIDDSTLPHTIAGSTAHVLAGRALDRMGRRLTPHVGRRSETTHLVERLRDRERRLDDARRALDRATATPYHNRVSVPLWVICFVAITPIEAVLSKTLVDRLAPEVGGLLSWAAVAGVIGITVLVTHELASILRAWEPEWPKRERRRAIVVAVLVASYIATMNAGIAMTAAPPVTHVVLALVVVGSTLLYWTRPDEAFVERLSCAVRHEVAERRWRTAARRVDRSAMRRDLDRQRIAARWLAMNEHAAAAAEYWAEPDAAAGSPGSAALDGLDALDWLERCGLVESRASIEQMASELVLDRSQRDTADVPTPPFRLLRPPTLEDHDGSAIARNGGAA